MSLVRRRVANPAPAALAIINPKKGGHKVATRKRRTSGARRRKSTRARKTTARRNPALSLTRRRSRRRGSVVARSRRRSSGRRRNPSGKLVPLAIGAAAAQMLASFIPFGGGPFVEAAKIFGVGWALERFLGRTVPMAFSEARDGGAIAAGVLLLNAYVVPSVRGAVGSVLPGGKGVNGIAVTPYPISPGMPPLIAPAQMAAAAQRGVNGVATAPRMR